MRGDDLTSRPFVYTYDVFHSCLNPRHVQSSTIILIPTSSFVSTSSTSFQISLPFLHISYILNLSKLLSIILKQKYYFLSILLSPLLVITFILGLIVPLLILVLKQALYNCIYLPFYLLILYYNIPPFLISTTTSISFFVSFLHTPSYH